MSAAGRVLVLGIGNLLWADEGFGVRAVQALHAAWEFPPEVEVMDGGTLGLNLLEPICRAHSVLVFDAIELGLPPATLRLLRDHDVRAQGGRGLSLHQASFQEVLGLAQWQGRLPQRITLIGVQPQRLDDLGGSLSPAVRARIAEAVALAVDELRAWGVASQPRQASAEALSSPALDMAAYEAGRPPEHLACRIGDARFLNQVHGAAG